MSIPPVKRRQVLTRDTIAILVALSKGEQIGSEIQSTIIGDTTGVDLHPSSLYDSLHRLVAMGLVTDTDKHYSLTEAGWHRLRIEVVLLEGLVQRAKPRIISSGHGRW